MGDPIVVHHGTPGSRLFAAVCSEAAAELNLRVVVPDRPGYGRSTPPPQGWSWRDWRSDLFELLDAEGIDRASLVGYSGGGPFALAAATRDRTPRVALVSSAIPPVRNWLASLSRVPFALRVLFRASKPLVQFGSREALVRQYTDRSVSETTARAVTEEFHEALRQGAAATARETRMSATRSLDPPPPTISVRAWHGRRDANAPIHPVRSFLDDTGTVVSTESDHLGTLLDRRRDVFEWAAK